MNYPPKEETLDPKNWEQTRNLGHIMLDDMINYIKNLDTQKLNTLQEDTIQKIRQPLPRIPQGYEKTYKDFQENIQPYIIVNSFPRAWAAVAGAGSVNGMLSEMLIAGLNSNTASGLRYRAPIHVHEQVIKWISEIMEFPTDSSGVLVSGAAMATFTGLAVARNSKAKIDHKKHGVQNNPKKMVLYCSTQSHACIIRSVELLGLGNQYLRWIPVNDSYQIQTDALENMIREDRANGLHPFCVVGNAGTVNTGACDDFNKLAEICANEDLWLHIDGAFGAWLKLSETHRGLVSGIEKADSLALDLHKWMNMPYEIGCVLIKDRDAHLKTFSYKAEYLDTIEQDPGPAELSVQFSRNFKALKAWMLFMAEGFDKYSRLVQQNLDQANYLKEFIVDAPLLELTAPVVSNVVCFRFKVDGLDEVQLNELNQKILFKLWFESELFPSDTTLNGVTTLRVCIINHRSIYSNFKHLTEEVTKYGQELVKTI